MNCKLLPISLLSLAMGTVATAEPSPLCTDLARYACSPGEHKDPTGTTRSQAELTKFMTDYGEKARKRYRDKFAKVLDDPDNEYFKTLSLAAYGLKNAPECTSNDPADQKQCREQLLDGLSSQAVKQNLGMLAPRVIEDTVVPLPDVMHVATNQSYKSVIEEFNAEAEKDLISPEQTAKISDKVFPQIKSLLIERVSKLSIPDEQKRLMQSKLRAIKFSGSKCGKITGSSGGEQTLSGLLIPNAFYDPESNTFTYCSGFMLQSTSEFQMAQVVAHELSHSLDPCQLAMGPTDQGFKYKPAAQRQQIESQHPFGNVLACLRGANSVNAQEVKPMAAQYVGGGAPVPYPPGPPGANTYPVVYPVTDQSSQMPSFCQNDQIPEAFADWLGFEVLPEYIARNYNMTPAQLQQGYANVYRTTCWATGSGLIVGDEHPATGDRINKILLAQPQIRSQMGCPPNHPTTVYCDADRAPAAKNGATYPEGDWKQLQNAIDKMQRSETGGAR